MKKAIAKLLPIDGKIKKREIFLDVYWDTYYTAIAIGKVSIVTDSDGYDVPLKDCKRVKLFAVTQDFDPIKYRQRDSGKLPIAISSNILGELSPNATWVKDGDEIEVERDYPKICIPDHAVHIQDMEFEKRVKKEEQKMMHNIYKVKCPTCNTYH